MVVVGVRLHQVYDIESVDLVFPCVLDPKEVPLSEPVRAIVVLKKQVVFKVVDLHGLAQVRAFKSTLKHKSLVLSNGLLEFVVGLEVFIVSVEARASVFSGFVRRLFPWGWHSGAVTCRLL